MVEVGRAKSIRLKCLDCTCHQPKLVRECPITDCPLHPYRMGKVSRKTLEKEEVSERKIETQ